MAGGEFDQAAVYNRAVEYDTASDEWSVVDDSFDTEAAMYLANQDVWISHWGGTRDAVFPERATPRSKRTGYPKVRRAESFRRVTRR